MLSKEWCVLNWGFVQFCVAKKSPTFCTFTVSSYKMWPKKCFLWYIFVLLRKLPHFVLLQCCVTKCDLCNLHRVSCYETLCKLDTVCCAPYSYRCYAIEWKSPDSAWQREFLMKLTFILIFEDCPFIHWLLLPVDTKFFENVRKMFTTFGYNLGCNHYSMQVMKEAATWFNEGQQYRQQRSHDNGECGAVPIMEKVVSSMIRVFLPW